MLNSVKAYSKFTDFDINLFRAGKHYKLYEKFGAHELLLDQEVGTYFAVWAPNAEAVSVMGNFNGWNRFSHPLFLRWDQSGIWEGFIPEVKNGEIYKYAIRTKSGEVLEKGDPFAFQWEAPPLTASIVNTTWYEWTDEDWMAERHLKNALNAPIAVYEMHLGSWMRNTSEPDKFLSYSEIAERLVPYILEAGFTHVEFMPIMEHPYSPSWGYQITGFYAPTARFGSAQGLMYLIEQLHLNGIGVILDWVPSHFPGDAHGLYKFDGTHLYEHADPRQGYHPDWNSYIFNYGRNEVRSFLISNAIYWLDRYHVDGLRVDAVASMLYLDYSRKEGEWIPNELGGRENLEAVSFLKEFNETVYSEFPDVQTIAEESTAWTGVSSPTFQNGLGFGMKWMMGWMNDTLDYFSGDPLFRKYDHGKITFSTVYAFTENFMLPLSHDEVVHGKKSLIYKMPGDNWQQYANLRALYLYMYTHPGTKLLFMGSEFAQTSEWNFDQSLDWHLMQYDPHIGIFKFIQKLNTIYKNEPALYEISFRQEGFQWLEYGDSQNSVLVYIRKGQHADENLLVILNLTPIIHTDYRVGLPAAGQWDVILNSDDPEFYGSGVVQGSILSEPITWMGHAHSAIIKLPPLSGLILKRKTNLI
jgi:1,4-alpha-glucan branching enzyme